MSQKRTTTIVMKLYFTILVLLGSLLAKGQQNLPDMGTYSPDEINLKECSFDKDAGAVILFDAAESNYDDEYHLITHRRVRLKILHQREIDRGNIRIRFYSKDKFEFITKIKGFTVSPDGSRITKLENKSVFTEKENDLYSIMKFAMPDVQPGSIIEYEYTSYMENYGGLDSWTFQHDIPVIRSCYELVVLPGTEFHYSLQKKENYPVTIKPSLSDGKIYYEMNNIPGLKFEPYMDAVRDYLQKVEFQLSGVTGPYGSKHKYSQTWNDLGYELSTDRNFGILLKKDLSGKDELKYIVAKETNDSGRIAAVYNYVRKNFTWNGYYSKYAEGLKNVWEKHVGNCAELNLLLVNLLLSFDIDAFPMLVAERDYGRVDTTYPFIDRFNKVVAFAQVGGKTFILDATQKFTPPNIIPYPLLNTYAFIVDKKDPKLVRIRTAGSYANVISINATIENNGSFKGTAEISSTSYAKQIRTENLRTGPASFVKQTFGNEELTIDDINYENIDDDNQPLVQKLSFHGDLNENGGFIFARYNLFTDLLKNPFTAQERFTNVNFGYRQNITLAASIKLPPKSQIDKLPEDKVVSLGNSDIIINRMLKVENDTLKVHLTFRQMLTLVTDKGYNDLRDMYKTAIELLNDPVIIRLSK